jgi:hypothetical protein
VTEQQPLLGNIFVDTLFPWQWENTQYWKRHFLCSSCQGYIMRTSCWDSLYEEVGGRWPPACEDVSPEAEEHQQLSQLRVAIVSWGWGQFGNPEEGERPPLKAANKQWLGKTEKTLCAVVTVIFGVCNSGCHSYL